jgi:MarR family transcriptional regulator for hemolysin
MPRPSISIIAERRATSGNYSLTKLGTKNGASADQARLLASFRMGCLIHDISRFHSMCIDRALKPIGVTYAQGIVLVVLFRFGEEGVVQSDLAQAMDLRKTTLVGLIDRLERKSYLLRRPDPEDRRIKHILLTDQGRRLLSRIHSIVTTLNAKFLSHTTAMDIARIEEVLSQMKRHLIEVDTTFMSKVPASPVIAAQRDDDGSGVV